MSNFKIWFDFTNSPHPVFFHPIIRKLQEKGCEIIITARDHAQTIPLTRRYGFKYKKIGQHEGPRFTNKALNLFKRAFSLSAYVKDLKVDIAVSHNSPYQAVTSYLLKIPYINLMDYEFHPSNHLTFRLADKILVPFVFADKYLKKFGACRKKIYKYNGLKEELYVSEYIPDPYFLNKIIDLGIETSKILVTVRLPASEALYHRFENPFFGKILQFLVNRKDVIVLITARTNKQRKELLKNENKNMIIFKHPLNGLDLIYYSDLFIGMGGTMTRESALLGTPTYSIFAGKKGSVDNYLINSGKIIDLISLNKINLSALKLEKKKKYEISIGKNNLVKEIVNQII